MRKVIVKYYVSFFEDKFCIVLLIFGCFWLVLCCIGLISRIVEACLLICIKKGCKD